MLRGTPAAPGVTVAPARVLRAPTLHAPRRTDADAATEAARLSAALTATEADLTALRDATLARLGAGHAAIFDAHLLLARDPEYLTQVRALLSGGLNAEAAVEDVSAQYIALFEALEDPYLRERAADLRDVRDRLLAHLLGVTPAGPPVLTGDAVLIAHDLSPSDTARLDRAHVRGLVTAAGGRTGHTAIMARGLGLPAVVGVGPDLLSAVRDGDLLLVDGDAGTVTLHAHDADLQGARARMAAQAAAHEGLLEWRERPSVSADGVPLELAANIGHPGDADAVLASGADGVGLYRTEFLFMGEAQLPDEAQQMAAYRAVLDALAPRPVVIRTLDVGGDKALPALNLPAEENPFLGYRAIRLCLGEPELFRTQLRALLRAGAERHLRVMFPMIATLGELRAARALLREEQAHLRAEGVPPPSALEVGMMVEVPAAAVMAHQFAPEVDFFSVGTNDLTGYVMAADRGNPRVAALHQPLHPAVLTLIRTVTRAAEAHGKWVGVCGELAGEPLALPVLAGLGVTELSMSAPRVLTARAHLARLNVRDARAWAESLLVLDSAEAVEAAVRARHPELA